MQRRSFIRNNTLALPLTACPSWIQLLVPRPIDMKPLRRNVGIFSEKGGTIGWLIQKDSVVVIDSQFREQAQHLISEIRKQEDAPIRYLINTHHHGDHTSGNIAFKGMAQNVLAHANSRTNQMNTAFQKNNEA